ncbi:MAG TPA: DUF998 domain-containing protein [Candidatus Saccharimonadales bacterium]|nr:DUF998 domain-containing protein [Candidatus Saccharimonadales bacterium]
MIAKQKHNLRLTLPTALAAAVLYCSWPLGYYLNPKASAHGLASELGAVGQPYNWVFISTDVLTGLLVAVIAIVLWWWLGRPAIRWLQVALLSYGVFGILTALDASLPMHCTPSLTVCPPIQNDHILIVHGVASIAAAASLFISVSALWYANRRERFQQLMLAVLALWGLFGLLSVLFFFVPGPGYLAQRYFIVLCSVWMVLLPVIVVKTLQVSKQVRVPQKIR